MGDREKLDSIPLWAKIPGNVPAPVIVLFLDFLYLVQRRFGKTLRKDISVREKENEHVYPQSKCTGYIVNQNDLHNLKYGNARVNKVGCEVIALYNALKYLGRQESLSVLLAELEEYGMICAGHWGTSPKALLRAIKRRKLEASFGYTERSLNVEWPKASCFIVTYLQSRQDVRKQVHTVTYVKEAEGWYALNVHGNGKTIGPCATFDEIKENAETLVIKPIFWIKL